MLGQLAIFLKLRCCWSFIWSGNYITWTWRIKPMGDSWNFNKYKYKKIWSRYYRSYPWL